MIRVMHRSCSVADVCNAVLRLSREFCRAGGGSTKRRVEACMFALPFIQDWYRQLLPVKARNICVFESYDRMARHNVALLRLKC